MSGSLPSKSARFARSSKLVAYLTVAYLLLVLYASLYPFTGWRVPNADVAKFMFAGGPLYLVDSDILLNILAYVPLGLLLTLLCMVRMSRRAAATTGIVAGTLLSLSIEFAQAFLPTRVSSNVDVLTNSIGTMAGASIACAFGELWLLSGELFQLRERHFRGGARTDAVLLLLAVWMLTQLNTAIWLFGNGNVRHWIPDSVGVRYSADVYLLLEAGVAALNFAAVAFLVGAIARSLSATVITVALMTPVALLLKTIASLALFIPGNPALWLTPGSVLGLVAGNLLWLPLARRSHAGSMLAAAICLVAGVLLVNLAPENPYIAATLQVLQRGQLQHFNAMTGLLSSIWPFLVLGYLAFLARHRDGRSGN